jgi:hypothetical protein
MIGFALYLAAFICFVLAAINIPVAKLNLTALGLAFAVAPQVLIRFM